MAIPKKIIKFLEKAGVKYEPIEHRTVYTAYDKAATLKVSPKIIGKTLVLKIDKTFAFVLIPANKNLDKGKFKKIARTKQVDFVKEVWMKKNLKGLKIGAVPPFGLALFLKRARWKLLTFADKTLLKEPKIIVGAGNYNWSIKISPAVLKKIVPDLVTGSFSAAKGS